uniref:Uncharacterized protein n=1 Tax=Cacopsylla melanoneura TaxID=428564 RepID=A0A8D8QG54_9HEMI
MENDIRVIASVGFCFGCLLELPLSNVGFVLFVDDQYDHSAVFYALQVSILHDRFSDSVLQTDRLVFLDIVLLFVQFLQYHALSDVLFEMVVVYVVAFSNVVPCFVLFLQYHVLSHGLFGMVFDVAPAFLIVLHLDRLQILYFLFDFDIVFVVVVVVVVVVVALAFSIV